jgi:uncharacterized protein YijF (DUF1287 family)
MRSFECILAKRAVLTLWLGFGLLHTAKATPEAVVAAARSQVGVTTHYDPAYVVLAYPGGDVPKDGGVCTDVVIRSLREAIKLDLQVAVHEDMKAHFGVYPKEWGLSRPDKNIDHRRVPNLRTYFSRHALQLSASKEPAGYAPGDIVTCLLPGNLPHIMIVSDRKGEAGIPLVIHNIGRGAQEEDSLFVYPLTGHYRLKP